MTDGEGSSIHASISGDVSGQVAVGSHNVQRQQHIVGAGTGVTDDDLAQLAALVGQLRAEVAATAPPEQRELALSRVDQLEREVTAERPDLDKLDYVKLWFATHLPRIAGLVAGIFVHPVVGKIVDSAGEAVAGEFRQRFGEPA